MNHLLHSWRIALRLGWYGCICGILHGILPEWKKIQTSMTDTCYHTLSENKLWLKINKQEE